MASVEGAGMTAGKDRQINTYRLSLSHRPIHSTALSGPVEDSLTLTLTGFLCMIDDRWSLNLLPPKGHKDVAEFAFSLFDISRQDKERLNKPQEYLDNYAMYRGQSAGNITQGKKGWKPKKNSLVPVNLYFSNVERTVANITARIPTGEVVDLDGSEDGIESAMSLQLKKWWKDTDQQTKTRTSARQMEIYGITPEKPVRNPATNQPDILVTDPFQFFPAPGNWDDLSLEAPYVCYLYLDYVSNIEQVFGVKDIASENAYDLLGQSREETGLNGSNIPLGNYADAQTVTHKTDTTGDKKIERGLIVEVWVRDNRETSEHVAHPVLDEAGNPVIDPVTGLPMENQLKIIKKVCPDGIRKITISKSKDKNIKCGWVVLDDCPNPNINYKHLELGNPVQNTYPWGRLPVYYANSYKDGVSIWGFSAAEQVGDLIKKINLIITKLVNYTVNVMAPPLIIQQHCGITEEMIRKSLNSAGRMVLMPSIPNARIEFMQIPNLPSTFFQVLDLIIKMFDRVYQIEDADRGVVPSGVTAASAIVALQERNQVLMQAKTAAIDRMVEERARWAIGLWQNFGTEEETATVNGDDIAYRPVDLVGRRFNFVVESGSSTPRTSLQVQEQAVNLATAGFIDRRALLETLNFPGWKEIIERMGETQLDSALQVLVDSGLAPEQAIMLKTILLQPQGGPGDTGSTKSNQSPKPGIPKAYQGGVK